MEIHEKVGPALAQMRLAANLTIRDVAERTGLAPATVASYEKGTRIPFVVALQIVDVLDFQIEDLVDAIGYEYAPIGGGQ